MFDVQRCLKEAQASYECRIGHTTDAFQTIAPVTAASTTVYPTTPLSKSKAKARLWLTGLSEKLVHYGNIFDVMVQHHPEYVSLAWGTFKLLFIVSTDSSTGRHQIPTVLSQNHMIPNNLLTSQGNCQPRRNSIETQQSYLPNRRPPPATLATPNSLPNPANANLRRAALCAHRKLLPLCAQVV